MKRIAAIFVLLVINGCRTHTMPNREVFAQVYPDEVKHYSLLAPASPEVIEFLESHRQKTIESIISTLDRIKTDPTKLERYIQVLKKIHNGSPILSEPEWSSFTNRLQKGDSVYFFSYKADNNQDRSYSDCGLLVLRNGHLVYRNPWLGVMLEGMGNTNAPLKGLTIDRL
jgi:hypothetical protein